MLLTSQECARSPAYHVILTGEADFTRKVVGLTGDEKSSRKLQRPDAFSPNDRSFMVALCNRETIYIFILFLSSFFFLLFFPRLISAVGDWMFTILWHMVWP